MDVGQAAFDSVVEVGQAFVIESQHMQDRGVQVVEGADVFHGVHAEFIARTVNHAEFSLRQHTLDDPCRRRPGAEFALFVNPIRVSLRVRDGLGRNFLGRFLYALEPGTVLRVWRVGSGLSC